VKPLPLIETAVPLDPLVGLNPLITGPVGVGSVDVTLKGVALVAVPQLVWTLTCPEVAPVGTVASITVLETIT
jgi:hypothetical protein